MSTLLGLASPVLGGRQMTSRSYRAVLPPEGDVVALFSHGDTIWKIFASLMGIDTEEVSHSTQNTSLSCLSLEKGGGFPSHRRDLAPATSFAVQMLAYGSYTQGLPLRWHILRLLQPHTAPGRRGR